MRVEKIKKRIEAAISEIISYDERKWEKEYVPMPLDFAPDPAAHNFGIGSKEIEANLELYIKLLENEGKIDLKWTRGKDYYTGERKAAYHEWIWIFTLQALRALKNYNRIEL